MEEKENQNKGKMAEYMIQADEINALVGYLGTKPYNEVINLIAILQNIAKIRRTDDKAPEKNIMDYEPHKGEN